MESQNQNEKFKIWWDEENGIIRYEQFVGLEMDDQFAQEISKAVDRVFESHPQADILINFSNVVGPESIPTSKGRKIISELVKKYASRRLALVNQSTVMRVVINFIIQASGHKDAKSFATEEEALKWLKSAS